MPATAYRGGGDQPQLGEGPNLKIQRSSRRLGRGRLGAGTETGKTMAPVSSTAALLSLTTTKRSDSIKGTTAPLSTRVMLAGDFDGAPRIVVRMHARTGEQAKRDVVVPGRDVGGSAGGACP